MKDADSPSPEGIAATLVELAGTLVAHDLILQFIVSNMFRDVESFDKTMATVRGLAQGPVTTSTPLPAELVMEQHVQALVVLDIFIKKTRERLSAVLRANAAAGQIKTG